jgi:EthD domain
MWSRRWVVFKLFGFVSKRADMTRAEFVDYYENHHVPLILSLAPAPAVYKRHYVYYGDDMNTPGSDLDFDAIIEQEFTDRAEFAAWITALTTGPAGERVAADEARFLDRSRTRARIAAAG